MLLSVKPQDRLGNKLLAALPGEDYERILPDLEQTSFSFGESVYESDERLNYAYFPITSVVSIVYTMRDGVSAEMGMVGNEGLSGFITILDRAGLEATACECYRVIKDEYDRLLDLRTSLSLTSVYATQR